MQKNYRKKVIFPVKTFQVLTQVKKISPNQILVEQTSQTQI